MKHLQCLVIMGLIYQWQGWLGCGTNGHGICAQHIPIAWSIVTLFQCFDWESRSHLCSFWLALSSKRSDKDELSRDGSFLMNYRGCIVVLHQHSSMSLKLFNMNSPYHCWFRIPLHSYSRPHPCLKRQCTSLLFYKE